MQYFAYEPGEEDRMPLDDGQNSQQSLFADAEEPKNKDFVQVYGPGWDRLLNMPPKSPNVARLYALLARHIAPKGGAVCVSYATMADALEISEMTARRAAEFLVSNGVVVRFKASTGAYVYALNPDEVWKSAHKFKKYAAFHTQTLASRRDTDALEEFVKVLHTKRSVAGKKSTKGMRVKKETAKPT